MAIELATAYLSIVPETSKVAPGVAKALGSVESTADKSGKAMGSKLTAAMGGVVKKTALGVGAAAGAALGAGLTKGLGRLNSIEQAQAKLKGLGALRQIRGQYYGGFSVLREGHGVWPGGSGVVSGWPGRCWYQAG